MREFFSIVFLSCVQIVGMILLGVSGALNAAGQILHVYFVHKATQHQIKFGPYAKEQRPTEQLPENKSKSVNARELN